MGKIFNRVLLMSMFLLLQSIAVFAAKKGPPPPKKAPPPPGLPINDLILILVVVSVIYGFYVFRKIKRSVSN